MTYTAEDILLISVPLTSKDREIAKGFATEHPNPEKRQQVYRNTLAVLATQRYFNMLDIPSELEASNSWNKSKRTTQDVADLFVSEIQDRIECRPIHADDDRCYIPQEAWQDRAGYIVVELKEGEREGIIRGYIPTVSVEQLPLSYLRPLDLLFDRIALGILAPEQPSNEPINTLRKWLSGGAGAKWLSPRRLPKSIVMQYAEIAYSAGEDDRLNREISNLYRLDSDRAALPAYEASTSPADALRVLIEQTQDDVTRWKAAELLHRVLPEHPSAAAIKAKDLGMYLSGHKIALLVGIIMKPDGRALVMTRVYPMEDLGILPRGLTLSGCSPSGQILFEVQARQHDDCIQFLFTMDVGDEFMLQVSLGTAKVTENFVI